MSYAAAAALQQALFARLTGFPALAGVAVLDAMPSPAPGTFVLLGPEEVREAGDNSGAGGLHLVQIAVISDAAGFWDAKSIAGAVCDALAGEPPLLTRGVLVRLDFQRARARRLEAGAVRRIDLTFAARIAL